MPVRDALTSFIDAEDIGIIASKVLTEPEKHINQAYSITGQEAINYYQVAKILSEELGRTIAYTNPSPRSAKDYWINIRGLNKDYCNIMGLLYMMTRMGTAKKVTNIFHDVTGNPPRPSDNLCKKILSTGTNIKIVQILFHNAALIS